MNRLVTTLLIGLAASQITGCTGTLPRAARVGSLDQVRALLDKGGDPNKVSSCPANVVDELPPSPKGTAIECALMERRSEIATLLVERGADPNQGRYPPLLAAAFQGHVKLVKLMLDKGADVNIRGFQNWTALASAAYGGHVEIVRELMARGADLESAMVVLEQDGDAKAKAGVKLLERLSPSQAPAAQPLAAGISKEELSSIVQAAVEGTARAQAKAAGQAGTVGSDIDKPGYRLPERPDDFALVIGIGKYSDIPEAQFAERDAAAVKDHLLAAGFPSRNVIQLFGEKAGRSAMEKFLETWLPRNVNEDSRVFFYFSGHGAPDPKTGEAYLIPWDGDPGFLENTGYPVRRLYEKLAGLRAKEVIVAMDACFSGAGGRSVLAKGARPLVMKTDAAEAPQNLTVFAAASGDQITSTLEDQGHGTFTYYFLKGLSGEAKDASGRVGTQALYDYLKPKVQDAARRQNRDQEPVLRSQGDRELIRF
ncbi:MAG: ankyrin repeat domain-containing protein [Elusimicrobiota bacterium]